MAAFTLPHQAHMTEVEYLATDFETDVDFVDGHIEERNVGEIEHSNWQRALLLWFAQQTSFTPLLAATEIRVRVAPGQYRVPDVAVFTHPPQGRLVTEPPLAIIEILSPDDSFKRLKARFRDYHAMGVRNLFVVESRTEFSQFRDDQFISILTGRSSLESSDGYIDWHAAAGLLWPNDLS